MHSHLKGVPSSVMEAPRHDRPQKKQEIASSPGTQQPLGRVKREAGGLREDGTAKEQHRQGVEPGPFRDHGVVGDE